MIRILAAIPIVLIASGARCAPACPGAGEGPVAVAAVDTGLELRLADGRRLRLVGLDPAARTPGDPELGETSQSALAALVAGRPLTARLLSDTPDRWGRLPAMAFLGGDPAPGGLAVSAIAAGLARYRPEPAAQACRDALLAAEAKARSGKLGLWHDPYYGVLARR